VKGRIARRDALLGLVATLAGCAGGGSLLTTPGSDRRTSRPLAAASSQLPQTPMVAVKTTDVPRFPTALTGGPTTTEPANGMIIQSPPNQPYLNAYAPDGRFVFQRDFAQTGPTGMPYFRTTTSDGQSVSVLLPDVRGVTPGSQLALGAGYTLTMDAAGAVSITNGTSTCTCSVDPVSSVATITRNGAQLPTVRLDQYAAFAGTFGAAASAPASARRGLQAAVAKDPGGGGTTVKCAGLAAVLLALLEMAQIIAEGILACAELIWPPAVISCVAVLAAFELVLLAAILYVMWQLEHCNDPSPAPSSTPLPRPTATAIQATPV
jgi:hypothetical protein